MRRLLRVLAVVFAVLAVAWLGTALALSAAHPRPAFGASELALGPPPPARLG